MIVITVDNEVDLKKVIKEQGIVVNSLTLSSMTTTLKISSVSLTFKTDGRWDWSSTDRNNEKTINDIRGRLGLDHLSNDEMVEYLSNDKLTDWDGSEPLRSGHITDRGVVQVVTDSEVCTLKNSKLSTYLIEDVSPVITESQRLLDEYRTYCEANIQRVTYVGLAEWVLNHGK